jgi:hypothetical protein
MYRILLIVLVTLLTGCGARAPEPELLIPLNVRCSTCSDHIRCENAAGSSAAGDQAFTLYVLEAKGPGNDEITSITAYFLQFVEPRTRFTRPLSLHVQTIDASGQAERHTSMELTAAMDRANHRIELPDAWIDQQNGAWHGKDDSLRGICRLLSREEGKLTENLFLEQVQ